MFKKTLLTALIGITLSSESFAAYLVTTGYGRNAICYARSNDGSVTLFVHMGACVGESIYGGLFPLSFATNCSAATTSTNTEVQFSAENSCKNYAQGGAPTN